MRNRHCLRFRSRLVWIYGLLITGGMLTSIGVHAQVIYRSGRYLGPVAGPSIYYGNREVTGGGPRNVTWYSVGGGYTSSLQTGLPWRRGARDGELPERLMEVYPGSIARSSRINSREYYVRDVNRRRRIDPGALPQDRFENEVEVAGEQVPKNPVEPTPVSNSPAEVAVPVSDVQEQSTPLPPPPVLP
jgi:hypothetical protein